MNRRRDPIFALLLAGSFLFLPGCDSTTEPEEFHRGADIVNVEVPDSIAVGESAELVAWISLGGCRSPMPPLVLQNGPRNISVHLQISDLRNATCTTDALISPITARARLSEPGTWTVDFVGENTRRASIVALGD